ncbi:hypothetical protein BN134_2093 [Cronobacter dublinensis 1210]|uniref:Uncharacterized protein n=1 Tax=Cronobacter dublinensis 1210 TaxID=1208656 RepID=A0ABM9Q789_9ENTR|nr:hypothetical protein BN134_2093 [Cronobacter dublinensis 1210]
MSKKRFRALLPAALQQKDDYPVRSLAGFGFHRKDNFLQESAYSHKVRV